MTSVAQIELFEPRPAESIDLCAQHLKRADAHDRLAQAFDSRSMEALARWERARATQQRSEADDLAAYFDLCLMAGLVAQ